MPAPIILNGIYTLGPGPSNLQDNAPASQYPWHIAWCSDRTPTAGYMLSNGIEWLLPTGPLLSITIGDTMTGVAGSDADVVDSGMMGDVVLDFTIPRGNLGDKGDPGDPGKAATVTVGSVTTVAPGTKATVTNSGTPNAAVLDFKIPRGADGNAGDPGMGATVEIGTVTTGAAGSNATVTNEGSVTNAVFDFSIPRGLAGFGTVTPSTPTRTLGTAFRPSTTKATLCIYSVKTQVTNPLLAGTSTAVVQLLSDGATTPTTERCRAAADSGVGLAVAVAITTANTSVLVYICPAGDYVRLVASGTGTHAESIISQTEITLG